MNNGGYGRKIIACIQIIFLVGAPLMTHAGLFDMGGSSIGKDMISGFIEDSLQVNIKQALKPITEAQNVADRKGKAPQVSIHFSTPNPKPGEVITATAHVTGITNPDDAHYMWYLKGPNRVIGENMVPFSGRRPGGAGESSSWHAFAIQAQAELYFDPTVLDQRMNGGNDNGSYIDEYEKNHTDNDGYSAPIGGGSNHNQGADYCYIHDPETGQQFELLREDAEEENQLDGCQQYDNATTDYVARCMIGDRSMTCPTKILPATGSLNSSSSGGENSSSESGGEVGGGGGARYRNLARCMDYGVKPVCRENNMLSCPSADGSVTTQYNYGDLKTPVPTPFCVPKTRATGKIWNDPNVSGCPGAKETFCFDGEPWPAKELYEKICGKIYGEERPNYYGASCHDYYAKMGIIRKPVAGTCQAGELNRDNTCSKNMVGSGKGVRPFPVGAGDGDFGWREELFYLLDPRTDRTTPLAKNDEALVMGTGVKEFTWRYRDGDQLGLVVEGSGVTPTKHEDSSYQTVFAMLSPGCKNLITDESLYTKFVKDKLIEFPTARTNLNRCIVDNKLYLSPSTSEFDTINVALSHGKDPNAAIASGLGQPLTITSSSSTQKEGTIADDRDLYAEWKAQCIKNNQEIDITNDIPELSKTQGTNLPTLSMTANFPEQCFDNEGNTSIVIEKKVNEPRQGGGSNFGQNTYTFHAYNAKDTMLQAKTTKASTNNTFEPADTICTEDIDNTLCRVMNNEVIAVTVPSGKEGMVSWTVNNQPYSCDASISSLCSNTQNTNTIIVPMRGNEGDHITIAAHIQDVDKDTNRKADLSRTFRITSPSVTIYPTSGAVLKVVGTYRNLKKQEFIDESSSALDITSPTVTLAARLYPAFLGKRPNTTYAWTVDGKPYGDTATISIAPENITKVAVRVEYKEDKAQRRALRNTFGIGQSDTLPTSYTASTTLFPQNYALADASTQSGFFATVSANAPSYLLFVLKMTLLIAMMLVIPSVILGFGRSRA